MPRSSVTIQIPPELMPSTHEGILKTIQEQMRFAPARFDQYDLIDCVAVLIGYVVSDESTLKAFYERLLPFAELFMTLFGQSQLLRCSTLYRLLATIGSVYEGGPEHTLSRGSAGPPLCFPRRPVQLNGRVVGCGGCE